MKNFITTDADGNFTLTVPVNATFSTAGDGFWSDAQKAVFVNDITLYVCADADEGDGDLGVNYDEATWNSDVDGLIYTDSLFIEQVRFVLQKAGFSTAHDVSYSEQGMQDYGRVSCDAYELAEEVRNAMQTVAA